MPTDERKSSSLPFKIPRALQGGSNSEFFPNAQLCPLLSSLSQSWSLGVAFVGNPCPAIRRSVYRNMDPIVAGWEDVGTPIAFAFSLWRPSQTLRWFSRRLLRLTEFERLSEPSPYARIDFPGFESAFHARLEIVQERGQRIPDSVFQDALAYTSAATGYRLLVESIGEAVGKLTLLPSDVVAVYLPPQIVKQFRLFRPDFRPVAEKKETKKPDSEQLFLFEELF